MSPSLALRHKTCEASVHRTTMFASTMRHIKLKSSRAPKAYYQPKNIPAADIFARSPPRSGGQSGNVPGFRSRRILSADIQACDQVGSPDDGVPPPWLMASPAAAICRTLQAHRRMRGWGRPPFASGSARRVPRCLPRSAEDVLHRRGPQLRLIDFPATGWLAFGPHASRRALFRPVRSRGNQDRRLNEVGARWRQTRCQCTSV